MCALICGFWKKAGAGGREEGGIKGHMEREGKIEVGKG